MQRLNQKKGHRTLCPVAFFLPWVILDLFYESPFGGKPPDAQHGLIFFVKTVAWISVTSTCTIATDPCRLRTRARALRRECWRMLVSVWCIMIDSIPSVE